MTNMEEGFIVVEVEGQKRRRLIFEPWQEVSLIFQVLERDFGKCATDPARLDASELVISAQQNGTIPVGTYTYKPKETYESYDPRFGHLATSSSLNFKTSRNIQENLKLRNLNFRPASAAPVLPLQLVHPVFARFLSCLRHPGELHPTKDDYDFYTTLSVASSEMLEEQEFKAEVHDLYERFFFFLSFQEEIYTGGNIGARVNDAVVLLSEVKQGVAGTDTDTQMQGIANYKLHWAKRRPGVAESYSDTSYPAFLLEHLGQWLKVGGLVTLGGKVCYQPLASVDLYAIHRQDLFMAEQGVKTLMALRKGLRELKDFWMELGGADRIPDRKVETLLHVKKLPYLLHRYDNGQNVERIADRLVYVVKGGLTASLTGDYIVKFVQEYGFDVHRAWGKANLAPTYRGIIRQEGIAIGKGGWVGVIMDLLPEEGWTCLWHLIPEMTEDLRDGVLKALERAHEVPVPHEHGSGYGVHGDMREANVMVKIEQGQLKDVKFIDFDWAKVEGQSDAVYPGFLNPALPWPRGAQEGLPMLREHDKLLLKSRVVSSCLIFTA